MIVGARRECDLFLLFLPLAGTSASRPLFVCLASILLAHRPRCKAQSCRWRRWGNAQQRSGRHPTGSAFSRMCPRTSRGRLLFVHGPDPAGWQPDHCCALPHRLHRHDRALHRGRCAS